MRFRALRLIPASFRFIGADVVNNKRDVLAALLLLLTVIQVALALRVRRDAAGAVAYGPVLLLGLWVLPAFFCRSWVDDDVRLGYGALWLQKPLRVFDFYFALIAALIAWAVLVTLAVSLTALPAVVIGTVSLSGVALTVIGTGWIPILLVILSFTGSAAGARNGALFAYAVLFAAFGLEGFQQALPLGPAYSVLKLLFPPARSATDAVRSLDAGQIGEGLSLLAPMLVYGVVCVVVGLALAGRVPGRLARGE